MKSSVIGKSPPEIEQELLTALRALGNGWHTRGHLADHLQKARLNPAEQILLERLVYSGQVEKRCEPSRNPHVLTFVYRVP